ncbi:MAG: radical SAM protein [Thermodesulfovibrionales bacterium]|nr:radical SAM protein [Thermodesulfovibrionales bacterium]
MLQIQRRDKKNDFINSHPCFTREAHSRLARIHLPVAPLCNIKCRYCIRKYDCVNESRPGITSRVLSPEEALERVRILVNRNEKISVIGIAGPGDPLANDSTFHTLKAIHREFPDLILCLSTNGLYLPERLEDLLINGVRSLTITINAVLPETAEKIYSWVLYKNKRLEGREAAECILCNQWNGLRKAVQAGLIVKINSVLIPGINDSEIPLIAWLAGLRGASLMNIIPLIPQAEFSNLKRPSREDISNTRNKCKSYISQMTHCRHCRADACGTLTEDKDMELEVLHAKIGEEYSEMII